MTPCTLRLPALLLVLSVPVLAQQPNSPTATQLIGGMSGPPWPVQGVSIPLGISIPATLQGLPNARFITFGAASLKMPGVALGSQRIDIDPATLVVVLDGSKNAAYRLDGNGQWTMQVLLTSSTTQVGSSGALQTLVEDPTSMAGATLTGAHGIQAAPGVTTINLALIEDGSQLIDLAPFNFTIPFYGTSYSSFYVSANGFISFNQQTTDFQPTPTEFLSQMPRIAMMWTDLSPQNGGQVQVLIDESMPIRTVTARFVNVPEFGSGPPHTFDGVIDMAGRIQIVNTAFNPAPPTFTSLQGITPGGNLSPVTALQDLSSFVTNPYTAQQQDEAIFEWFGTPNMVNWTLPATNPFDMTGLTLSYAPLTPGVYTVTAQ